MNHRTALFSLVTIGLMLCCGSARAMDLARPQPTSYPCRGSGYVAEIFPPKSRQNPGDKPVCYLYQMGYPGGTWKIDARLKWKAELINDQTTYYRMPHEALVSRDGHLVTLNDYSRIGYKNAVVIYGSDGKPVKSWHLDQLVPKDELKQIALTMHGRLWNQDAKYYFLRRPARFYILLKTGRAMEFSLKDGAFKYGTPADFPDLAAVTKKRHSDEQAKVWAISLRFSSITDVLEARKEKRGRIEKMQNPDHNVRNEAISAFVGNATDAQIEQLCDLLKHHEKPEIRRDCARALGAARTRKGVPALIEALTHKSWLVRRSTVNSLTMIGDDRASDPLVAVLSDKEPEIRRHAAVAFQILKNPKAVEPLIAMLVLEAPEPGWRMSDAVDTNKEVAIALGFQGDKRALPALAKLLDFPYQWTARHAAKSMGQIVGEDFTEEVQVERFIKARLGSPTKAKAWWKTHSQEEAKE